MIDEKPTGSKDPFALRRAALGVIRILLATSSRVDLRYFAMRTAIPFGVTEGASLRRETFEVFGKIWSESWFRESRFDVESLTSQISAKTKYLGLKFALRPLQDDGNLLAFFADRLKVHLKDDGISHDVLDAVFALGDDDLVRVTNRARALQGFLDTGDGKALLAGYRRAANILRAEEKTDGEGTFEGELDSDYAPAEAEETALIAALETVRPAVAKAVEAEDFEGAMAALSQMRAPVDAFFDKVTVNDKDGMLRRNRLRLLASIRAAAHTVADFGRIEG
ncbi:MAG: hypothetical protein COW29_11715 [Rhodobacterales bacterium CG15_BIG_FIL_POST_REV_8_21_14_020_59_13]|nr:MAG: hypothetical protein COW29_11715 [Rhodobacterales bacterium CG15_BIG_FIL_POST_REV_8_21_14_020_59_13]